MQIQPLVLDLLKVMFTFYHSMSLLNHNLGNIGTFFFRTTLSKSKYKDSHHQEGGGEFIDPIDLLS